MLALFALFFLAWIGLSVVWLATFFKRGRLPFARRGFRFRRVRWASAIAATAAFFLASIFAQWLSTIPQSSPQLQAGRPAALVASPAADAVPASELPPVSSTDTAKAEAESDAAQPVTEAQTTAGVTALCSAVFEKVGELARGGEVKQDGDLEIIKLMVSADDTLSKELGVSEWRAQKILGVSIDRMKSGDPDGNLVTYCLNHKD